MTWMWTWKTSWPASFPFARYRLTASHRSPLRRIAAATFRAVSRMGPTVPSGKSSMKAPWRFGITRACPGVIGRISMNARVASSSYSRLAGASPRTIWQKMQPDVGDGIGIGLFLRRRPEHSVRNDQLLDLVRALVQAEDPRVPVVPLHVEVPAEPVPAMDLDRPVRHALRHLRPKELRHGDFERVVQAQVPHLRGAEGEQPRRVDLQCGLCDHLADELEVPDRPTERLAFLHVLHGGLERGARDPDGPCGDPDPPAVQRLHRLVPTVPAFSNQVIFRDSAAFEGQVRGGTRPRSEEHT